MTPPEPLGKLNDILALAGHRAVLASNTRPRNPINLAGAIGTTERADLLTRIEELRVARTLTIDRHRRSQLGQFFTPASIARFMAGLFVVDGHRPCHLLDAGAGIGSLSAAFLERISLDGESSGEVSIDAFEIDHDLHGDLATNLNDCIQQFCATEISAKLTVRGDDFIFSSVQSIGRFLFNQPLPEYSHAILNPPYRKIRSDSEYRRALRTIGIETVNMYSAFVALALSLLDPENGQLVAIIPRSFCNGPYYRPFRDYILNRSALDHIHLFSSRDRAFKDDDVLQENVIVRLQRGKAQSNVTVTTSTDDSFSDLVKNDLPFEQVVVPDDPECFIQIPTSSSMKLTGPGTAFGVTLDEIGISVSTGPVVDFRLKNQLYDRPEVDTVPLLYPRHLAGWQLNWPIVDGKKPNAIRSDKTTRKWLYPNGFYCVVRRFSSKEEKRRIVASVIRPGDFPDYQALGIENHLNIFHMARNGLPDTIAHGLAVFLNSSTVDQEFRRFNGHTQVNATDLRRMKYPSKAMLSELGKWAMASADHSQDQIDHHVGQL